MGDEPVSGDERIATGAFDGAVPRERRLEPAEEALRESIGRGVDGRSTDVASGQGAPWWVRRTLNHCSNCGARLEQAVPETEHRERSVCPACGFIAYVNPRLVVTTIPVTEAGEAVLLRRGIEPGMGAWAQPGGFLEVDETVAEAAVRETLEETGLLVAPGELIGLYSRLEAAVVVIVFEARIVGGEARTTPEALEVASFAPRAIPWDEVAFKTSYWALRDWVATRDPDAPLPDAFRGWEQF